MTTLRAPPPVMWSRAPAPLRNRPLASMTTSTPASAHGMRPGCDSWNAQIGRLLTMSWPGAAATVPGNRPRTLSRLRPYAKRSTGAMSLMAATVIPVSAEAPTIRIRLRPIRPKPLMPIAILTKNSLRPDGRRTYRGATVPGSYPVSTRRHTSDTMSVQVARQPERAEEKLTSRAPGEAFRPSSLLTHGSALDSADHLRILTVEQAADPS